MHYKLNLDIEPNTSLDEILNFIRMYWYKWPYDFWNLYFEDGIEFKSKYSLDFFHWLLHLHLENAIDLEIKWDCENEMWRKNKKINIFLKENKEESSWMLSNLINWKSYKYYNINNIESNIEYFNQHIKYLDYLLFNIRIKWYQLLTLLFNKIHKELWYENINQKKISENLYKNILEQTWWKNNYLNKITIFYNFFNDYIKDNRIILPIISELENKWNLKIKNIKLENEYIYFEFDRINNISEKLFIELAENIVDSSNTKSKLELKYTENNFILNNKNIDFKAKTSKIYQIFLLVFDTFNKYKKNHVSFDEINNILSKNPEKYFRISSKDLVNYDTALRKNIEEKNKSIEKKHNISELIGINKSWISCGYYNPEE